MNNIEKHLEKIIYSSDSLKNDFISKNISCVLEYISKQKIIDNEIIIEDLIDKYKLPHIKLSTPNVRPDCYDKINEYYKNGYFVFHDINKNKYYAVNDLKFLKQKKVNSENNIFLITKDNLFKILEREFSDINSNWAKSYLESINKNSTAKNIDYLKMVVGFFIIFFTTLLQHINLFNIINNITYLVQNILKSFLFKTSLSNSTPSPYEEINDALPIYSVMIPLYKEELKIDDILSAIKDINYPKDKLDVKFVIEADDIITIRAIKAAILPSYIHVIKVPYSFPRTKPKALNYAMPYVKGDLLTIYDAEDIPDPNQLLKAVYAFQNLPNNYVCVQAKLNFYNANKNILTRFFSVEYSLWFEYLLKGLSIMNLPVTLGGTSNHFKVDKLKEVGYWDAYNVTEDADLGIRMYLKGYKVHLIDSVTMEEAPTKISVWIAQRARWIKGFFQTIYVFMRTKKDRNIFPLYKIFSVYIFVGFATYSFFCMPWLFACFALDVDWYVYYLWGINSIFAFAYMYSIVYIIMIKKYSSLLRLKLIDWIILILWPSYFLLHTIACYRAIWEMITHPFKWNKTPHGNINDSTKKPLKK